MSSLPRVRRRKRTRQGRLRTRRPSIEVVEDENPQRVNALDTEPTACIDLTCADGADDDVVVTSSTQPVVDLTSIIDSPIVIGTPDSPNRQRRRTRWPSNSDSDSDLLELPPVPFFLPDTSTRPQAEPVTEAAGSGANAVVSPPSSDRTVTCPVCLDNSQEIRRSGRQLFSTTCGHVFCNECINDSIKSQKRCPSCRKKLTTRQIHPLFI